MRREVVTRALIATWAVALLGMKGPNQMAADDPSHSASGRGTMVFGEEGTGRGLLRFEIEGEPATGTLMFAAEHHHDFPDIVIELGSIDTATFSGRSVRFSGQGALHDDLVTVTVRADDRGKRDRFAIRCVDADNHVLFEADGELVRGDIIVGGAP